MSRILIGLTLALGLTCGAWAQSDAFGAARSLVSRTQDDLKHAAHMKQGHKERERYENVQHHLSDFDRSLAKAKFDKGKLDEAIEDLQHVIDHNTLSPEDRDALMADVRDLRAVRERRGAW